MRVFESRWWRVAGTRLLILFGAGLIIVGSHLPWIEYDGEPLGRITTTGLSLTGGFTLMGGVALVVLAMLPYRRPAPPVGWVVIGIAGLTLLAGYSAMIDLEPEPWWELDIPDDVLNAVRVWAGTGWKLVFVGSAASALGGARLRKGPVAAHHRSFTATVQY